jgi:hypothetical protein
VSSFNNEQINEKIEVAAPAVSRIFPVFFDISDEKNLAQQEERPVFSALYSLGRSGKI